jgi:hypothetical protein
MKKCVDLTMLAFAAKAATTCGGLNLIDTFAGPQIMEYGPDGPIGYKPWMPHKNRSQAFELAVELSLGMSVFLADEHSRAWTQDQSLGCFDVSHNDYYAEEATCRAITMAAAAMGEKMMIDQD